MKSLKKFLALACSLALVAGFVQAPALKAEAATPTTWYVTYDIGADGWYSSIDQHNWNNVDISQFQAGDNLIINADGYDVPQLVLWVPQSVNILSATGNSAPIIYAPFVNYANAANGANMSVNCDVAVVEAGYTGVIQVNGNVGSLTAVYADDDNVYTIFGVTGTVDKANVKWTGNLVSNTTTVYNVAKGKLITNDRGFVPLNEGEYSLVPLGSTLAAPAAPAQAPAGKQLDDVPKTGTQGVPESAVFFGLAAVFAIGAVFYKKKVQN